MVVLIIEDEPLAAQRLGNMLSELDPDLRIAAVTGSIRESLAWLQDHRPDLIFSDIRLSDGLSFKIFEKTSVQAPVIFTTAYDQYAIRAFEVHSVDYLLKPIEREKLRRSLEKVVQFKNTFAMHGIDLPALQKLIIKEEVSYRKRFTVNIGPKLKVIEVSDIAYFFIRDKNVFIRTREGRDLALDHSLDAIEEELDPALFFRLNRKFIAHIEAIDNIYALSKSRMKVGLLPASDEEVLLSYQRARAFRSWLNQ